MKFKILIDMKNGDQFYTLVNGSKDYIKEIMSSIDAAINRKSVTVSISNTDYYVVSEIIAFSYEEIKLKRWWR